MRNITANMPVTINSPHHRAHGKTGTVVSAAPSLFMGTWLVLVDGVEYAFLPSELTQPGRRTANGEYCAEFDADGSCIHSDHTR